MYVNFVYDSVKCDTYKYPYPIHFIWNNLCVDSLPINVHPIPAGLLVFVVGLPNARKEDMKSLNTSCNDPCSKFWGSAHGRIAAIKINSDNIIS